MKKKSANVEAFDEAETSRVEQITTAPTDGEQLPVADEAALLRKQTVTFKKALAGFDPNEVLDYIEHQEANAKEITRVYEKRIGEMKAEVTLYVREIEALKKKIQEQKQLLLEKDYQIQTAEEAVQAAQIAHKVAAVIGENETLTAVVAPELEKVAAEPEKVEAMPEKAEAEPVKAEPASTLSDDELAKLMALEQESRELLQENSALKARLSAQEKIIEADGNEIERLNKAAEESRTVYALVEKLKIQTESYRRSAQEAQKELVGKIDYFESLAAENQRIKKGAGDFEEKRKVYEEQITKYESKINELLEANRQIKNEFTRHKTETEAKAYAEKYKILQAIQVHAYQIKQSELTMQELLKQFDAAKKTLENIK